MTIEDRLPELPAEALAAAKAYGRIETDAEDASIAAMVRTASELCESFTGQLLVARAVRQRLRGCSCWTRLARTPVAAIEAVETIGADGSGTMLPADDYAIDIDANGDGWVRCDRGDETAIRVIYRAGMAPDWDGLPDALRQGILRMTAHLYAHRDGADGDEPPAAVTALWRPWRQMVLR